MSKIWAAISGIVVSLFMGLLVLLRIRTKQRDSALDKAQEAQAKAESVVKATKLASRVNRARQNAALAAKEVQNENIKNADLPPTGNFGDKRLRDNKD